MGQSDAMRIAVYGGSFNPVGNHHVALVEALLGTGRYHRVILVPNGNECGKKGLIDERHRLEMCRLAFSWMPCVVVPELEMEPLLPVTTLSSSSHRSGGDQAFPDHRRRRKRYGARLCPPGHWQKASQRARSQQPSRSHQPGLGRPFERTRRSAETLPEAHHPRAGSPSPV
ncbi:MAG: hypothetical protein HN341_14185 [Verrucomicrobia bacterium]|nr:hypothetical protein [Verrucomicrobiota bacterium]